MALYYGNQRVCPTIKVGGGQINNQDKTVTENGTYTADTGYTGLGTVTVQVTQPEPDLVDLSVTENGTYTHQGHDGYDTVIVNVPSSQSIIPMDIIDNELLRPSQNFTFTLPNNITKIGALALSYRLYYYITVTSVDLSNITQVATNGLNNAFTRCTNLVDIDLSNLTTVGIFGLQQFCSNCSKLTTVNLSSLSNMMSSSKALQFAFEYCVRLQNLYFPSLNSSSFGSSKDQFNNMLYSVVGCTVHFPSNLQSVIGNWSDVLAGFGGTNTTILFDLPATT